MSQTLPTAPQSVFITPRGRDVLLYSDRATFYNPAIHSARWVDSKATGSAFGFAPEGLEETCFILHRVSDFSYPFIDGHSFAVPAQPENNTCYTLLHFLYSIYAQHI